MWKPICLLLITLLLAFPAQFVNAKGRLKCGDEETSIGSLPYRINRIDEIVRVKYKVAILLNKTHALYKTLTAYIDIKNEEILYKQIHQGVWYAPGLKAIKIEEIKVAQEAFHPEFNYGIGVLLVLLAIVIIVVVARALLKAKKSLNSHAHTSSEDQ